VEVVLWGTNEANQQEQNKIPRTDTQNQVAPGGRRLAFHPSDLC